MKCPYCYRTVKDMPDHLKKSGPCKTKHAERLSKNLTHAIRTKLENDQSKEDV